MKTTMKHTMTHTFSRLWMGGLLGLSLLMTACSSAESSAALQPGFESGKQAAQAFEEAGYTISDVRENADQLSFRAVSKNGGANVTVSREDDATEALQAFENRQAVFSQSDYYIRSQQTTPSGNLSLFCNSVNGVDAALALNKENGTLVSVRELMPGQVDEVVEILNTIGTAAGQTAFEVENAD